MVFFFFKQKTAYEIRLSLVGSEMCIRDRDMSEISAYLLSARIREAAGNSPGAEEDLRTAIKLAPQAWKPAQMLAELLESTGRPKLAAKALEPFTAGMWTRGDASLMLAALVRKGVEPDPAIRALEHSHKAAPEDDIILMKLVELAIETPAGPVDTAGTMAYADILYQRATQDRVPALVLFARAVANHGETQRAREILEAALSEPADPRIQSALQSLR